MFLNVYILVIEIVSISCDISIRLLAHNNLTILSGVVVTDYYRNQYSKVL